MILLVFPNQLFIPHPGLELQPDRVVLLEDALFFGDRQYPARFHKQKLWLHRATMKRFARRLTEEGHEVQYVDFEPDCPSIADVLREHVGTKLLEGETLVFLDPIDDVLQRRLKRTGCALNMDCRVLDHPGFLNTAAQNQEYRSAKSRWFMADFYKWQRQRLNLLMEDGEPVGGQWSFDADNRKKIPKNRLNAIPEPLTLQRDDVDEEARRYVEQRFAEHPGSLDQLYYPTSHDDARRWLDDFLRHRFAEFGDFEDAIEVGKSWLWHSVLTPVLNIGLLTPQEVVDASLQYSEEHSVPINSLEGFLRQVAGWREFMRATYEDLGVPMRTTNHWNHQRPLPQSFYTGETGILPVDDTIRRVLATGYCHHIERLMVLGGFMFLCEIDPDDVYRWFMELFVDAYDWVMVPNVYAMSQHADGGSITTKPYFSGSSYIRRMSHYAKGPWCDVWDGLYWRWIWNHADELGKNPRWAMMCSTAKKMDREKRDRHLEAAETFLGKLC